MMHENRAWCVAPVATIQELADKLSNYSWCCCTGFELGKFLWLNDATGPDGAQEYSVLRRPTEDDPHFRQVESITASWCSEQQLLSYIKSIHEGEPPQQIDQGPVVFARSGKELMAALGCQLNLEAAIVHPTIESPAEHGRCCHCA